MIKFRDELRLADSAIPEHEYEVSEKLAVTITNGMQQMQGFAPDPDILTLYKKIEAIHGKADS